MVTKDIITNLARKYRNVIDSEEFYFQKGQDSLNEWLKLRVDKALELKILRLAGDYDKFQKAADKDAEVMSILERLFTIISYCDVKAKDKIKYNQYSDKRTLAQAAVRMNHWVEKLVLLKFKKDEVPSGSILNAANYLLNPAGETTILSENHRQLISHNLLKRDYNPSEFTNQILDYFSQYHLTVSNPQNYTYLLSCLVYGIGDEWKEDEINNPITIKDTMMNETVTSLNQIFFGPPGTGKTYHTVSEAIKIVDPEFYNANESNRTKLKERFRELLIKDWKGTQGQIAFCTFHQSFSYEDFVEGIKPVSPEDGDTYLKYKVEDGIFKRICRLSEDDHKSNQLKTQRVISWNEDTFKKAVFYKISLGNSNKEDDQAIYEYCIKNNCIALGYGGETDFTGLDEEQVIKKCKELGKESFTEQAVNRFIHYIKEGNYVLVSNGNRYVRAIGRVTGPYRYDPNTSIRFHHYRSVEWIVKDENIPIADLYDRALSQQTIYKLDEDGIKKEFFVNTGQQIKSEAKQDKNFVLIIDEINRGNVSSIFGELITLIEKDKRSGGDEQLEVTLPYSKESFTVPDNVYIIGTMNTADRSIEALDTALRRRFSFREMQSDSQIVATKGVSKGKIDGIDLVKLLNTINQRIEKLIDKDHKIGHAYFMDDITVENLKDTFHNKVIPLLQEYFFGDFGKIGLVLGNDFVEKVSEDFSFAKFESYDSSVSTDLKERPVYKITDKANWKFQSIYE